MINYKPTLVKALKTISSNVFENYSDNWENLPIILYEEETNAPYTITTLGERMTLLAYRIDIYSNTSTSDLKNKINDCLTQLGFTRSMCLDTKDIDNRKHTIMRFEGVIDLDNNRIYRK